MATKFEHTFSSVEMTVEVLFDYSWYTRFPEYCDPEMFVDDIAIMQVKCNDQDLTAYFEETAPLKLQLELIEACRDYAEARY